jgi:hypothetical protein
MGIDPDGTIPTPQGLDMAIMPSSGTKPGAGRLTEIE